MDVPCLFVCNLAEIKTIKNGHRFFYSAPYIAWRREHLSEERFRYYFRFRMMIFEQQLASLQSSSHRRNQNNLYINELELLDQLLTLMYTKGSDSSIYEVRIELVLNILLCILVLISIIFLQLFDFIVVFWFSVTDKINHAIININLSTLQTW